MDSTRYMTNGMSDMSRPLQRIIYTLLVNKIDRVVEETYPEYEQEMHRLLKDWCEAKQRQFNLNRPIQIFFVSALSGAGIDEAFDSIACTILAQVKNKAFVTSEKQAFEEIRAS